MPIRSTRVALLLSAFLAWSCTREPSSGASTETTNGLTGFVTDENGRPAVGARVSAWDSKGRSRLATTFTDSAGRWKIRGLPGVVGIDILSSDAARGAWSGGQHADAEIDSLPPVRLAKLVDLVLSGQKSARLAGTPYTTTDGILRSIPPGSYTVLRDTSATALPSGSIRCGRTPSDTFSTFSDSGLLVEDFDDGDSTWIYGAVRDNRSRWFAQNSPQGANLSRPMVAESTATPGFDTVGAWRGRSLHIRYTTTDTGSFAQVGMYYIGLVDLSNLRQIRLRIRGDGIFRLSLNGYDSLGGARATWQAVPTGSWRQIAFKVGEELPAGPSDPRRQLFPKISKHSHLLMLQAYGGTELQIDDIRFDGVAPSAFLP